MRNQRFVIGIALLLGFWMSLVPMSYASEFYTLQTSVQVTMPVDNDDPIRGQTLRWTFQDGPTGGITFEHTFREDGTLVWRALDGPMEGATGEEAEYAAVEVAESVYAVSYRARSGHTLTVVLNFEDMRMTGFASSSEEWHAVSGTFELVD